MLLEDYFNFLAPNDIRLKGSRIGIETILYEYIYRHQTPEEIANIYSSLTLEQIYATILYYLHNKEIISQYIANWLEWSHQVREEQKQNPSQLVKKLMEVKAAQTKEKVNDTQISHG